MPTYFVDTNATDINTSELNTIINYNKTVSRSNTNNKISTLRQLFKDKADGVNLSKNGQVKFSDFREAQVLTMCIRGKNESTSTYNDTNNGEILVKVDCQTVIGNAQNTKVYEVSIVQKGKSPSFVTKTGGSVSGNCNCKFCVTNQSIGESGRTYTIIARDGTSTGNISQDIKLSLSNAADKVCSCVQGQAKENLRS